MFEDLFDELARKYSEDFNWSFIPYTNKYFIEEAKREIKEGHPLYGEIMYSTIKCDSNDDVMYVISEERYVIIHLTYSKNIDNSYPHFILLPNVEEALIYIENKYLKEYM
ncbi:MULTISPECIES: hypothetical protein [Clostridium]|uniref:hypothetical protein n=1 Tax=Clostridium TaxID=1485 RepID=UPI000823FE79|nr:MULTISPECIES: hypothetical protein [Clostridium]PJI09386.1 hypothetical protein CUB90_16520 [Clostridium sp. CT7]